MIAIRLLIDMDEVICDFLGELFRRYNRLTGKALRLDQLKQYDLTPFVGRLGEKIYFSPGFFAQLQPFPYALDVLRQLQQEGHHLIVATDARGNSQMAADKKSWVRRHLPFLPPQNFVVCSHKYRIKADLLFDDSPFILNRFNGIKVVMDRPYNQHVKGQRIYNNNWLDFHTYVRSLTK